MLIVSALLLIVVYAVVRWRYARKTFPADTGMHLERAWRRRGRIVETGEPDVEVQSGTVDSQLTGRFYDLFDRVVRLTPARLHAVHAVLHGLAAILVFLATARCTNLRAAVFAIACYLLATAIPHSFSYFSVPGNLAAPLVAAGFMLASHSVLSENILLLPGLAGALLALAAIMSGNLLAIVLVPSIFIFRILFLLATNQPDLDISPVAVVAFNAGSLITLISVFAATGRTGRYWKFTRMRDAHLVFGPFFRLTCPLLALAITGILVYPATTRLVLYAFLVGLAGGLILHRSFLPRNALALLPVVAVSAGVALDRLVFNTQPGVDVYRAGAISVLAVWAITTAVAVWLHGWRLTDRASLQIVAAPLAGAADAARTCGEYIARRARAGARVANLTGLSSIPLYASDTVATGRAAWLSAETDEPGANTDSLVANIPPDVIVTDESRLSVLALDKHICSGHRLSRIVEGRFAVYMRQEATIEVGPSEIPELSIVVVAHNGAESTAKCLRSIARTVDMPYELIVVDNGSAESMQGLSGDMAGARIVRLERNCGYAGGVNAGVAAASDTGLVLLLHNDVILTEECVSRMVHAMNRESADAVGPQTNVARAPQRLDCPPIRNIIELESYSTSNGRANYRKALGADSLGGFCMLVRREAFDAVAGFDTQFNDLLYGDADFCQRLIRQNARLIVALDAFVIHHGAVGWFELFLHGTDLDRLFNHSMHTFSDRWHVVPELTAHDTLTSAALRARARRLMETGSAIEALKLLVEAARVRPTDAVVYNDVGAALWSTCQHEEALANFRRALEMNPGLAEAAANLKDAAETPGCTDDVAELLRLSAKIVSLGLDL